MIRIDSIWLATETMDMRAGTALGGTVALLGGLSSILCALL